MIKSHQVWDFYYIHFLFHIAGHYFLRWNEKFNGIREVIPKGMTLRNFYQPEYANALRFTVVQMMDNSFHVLCDNWTYGDKENSKLAYAVLPRDVHEVGKEPLLCNT